MLALLTDVRRGQEGSGTLLTVPGPRGLVSLVGAEVVLDADLQGLGYLLLSGSGAFGEEPPLIAVGNEHALRIVAGMLLLSNMPAAYW